MIAYRDAVAWLEELGATVYLDPGNITIRFMWKGETQYASAETFLTAIKAAQKVQEELEGEE